MAQELTRFDIDGSTSAFKAKCKDAGLKVTPQRMATYQALVDSKEHPSADMVYSKVRLTNSNVSFDTVNRTLLTLNEMGVATIVEGSGEPKRYDANLSPHQHFKCVKCRRIIDFHDTDFDDISVPAELEQKFVVLRKSVYFEGVCDICLDEAKA
jgi:Fur family transcriptional regulator, peroxide stress response regulator